MGQVMQRDAGEKGFYYKLFDKADWFCLMFPPLIAITLFIIFYLRAFLGHTTRIRTKALVKL
jgi:hypothetical protein